MKIIVTSVLSCCFLLKLNDFNVCWSSFLYLEEEVDGMEVRLQTPKRSKMSSNTIFIRRIMQ